MDFSRAEIILLIQTVMDVYAEKCAAIDDILETMTQQDLTKEDLRECEEVMEQLELEVTRLIPLLDKLEGKKNPNVPLKQQARKKSGKRR